MQKPILIFPAGMPRSLEFLGQCLREQLEVIGASSLGHDPARKHYPRWLALPYVADESFDAALQNAVRDFNIGGIYTPNHVVWGYLHRELSRIAPDVELINPSPTNTELESYRAAKQLASTLLNHPLPLPLAAVQSAKANLSEVQIAALFRHAETIPGMCDHEKIRALYEICRHCGEGDVVEIGSWWGKSAFVLLGLARSYGIGRVLCVDPWSDSDLVQNDAKGLVDIVSAHISANEAFQVFLMNLLPYSAGDLNYVRAPSTDGAAIYRQNSCIESADFGTTQYSGQIALLHIDGNHSYENAKADVEAWVGNVISGGWIVMDDYRWPYGDGPRRAADEYLETHASDVSCAFFMGGALFIRKH